MPSLPVIPGSERTGETPVATRVAMVAALEREVRPLVKHWQVTEREFDGRTFKFFENAGTVLVCGGIGAQAARRATEAVIRLFSPDAVVSVGFAGALDDSLKVGDVFVPGRVVDASDGSRVETDTGLGVLISFAEVAGGEQKKRLAAAYGAQAVDMEAAAVARGAQAHGLRFSACKAISDASDFEMPAMEGCISPDGQLRTAKLVASSSVRPWTWANLMRLGRNSAKASKALCIWIEQHHEEWHPSTGVKT